MKINKVTTYEGDTVEICIYDGCEARIKNLKNGGGSFKKKFLGKMIEELQEIYEAMEDAK